MESVARKLNISIFYYIFILLKPVVGSVLIKHLLVNLSVILDENISLITDIHIETN